MFKAGSHTKKIIILSISSFVVSLAIFLSGVLNLFELKAYDLFSRYLNPATGPDNIVIIRVDQQSIDALSKEGITWPWPRQMYVPVVEYLSEADAIFMDILFTEPSSYGKEDDVLLSEAFRKTSNVYLPVFLTRQQKVMSPADEEFVRTIALKDGISPAITFNAAIAPIDVLKTSVKGSGNVTIPPDEDGVYRKIPLVFQLRESTIPHFVLSYLIHSGSARFLQNSLFVQDTEIHLADGKLMLRYYSKRRPFQVFSFAEILSSSLDSKSSRVPSVRGDFFKGKIVFIGLTAAGLYDLKPTPIFSLSPGVLIHATVLDNLMNRNFIKPVSSFFVIIFMLLICLVISYSVLRYYSIYINLTLFLVSLLIILFIIAVLFKHSIYMNIIHPTTSLTLSFMISIAYCYAREGKERLFLKRTFLQYMDKKIADYLIENPSLIKPGGQLKKVTIFFADITGFTSIAEKDSPEKTAKILYTILNSFTEVIIRNDGVIDKYIGDCIMAFWGAPFNTDRDETNACRAALQCIESLHGINKSFQREGIPEIAIRIGLHSGNAIAGNLGSDRLFDYTVVGDTVNLASRLESANKLFKTEVVVSEDTLKNTGGIFFTRELGLTEVKGKTMPINIFELISEGKDIHSDKREMVEIFHQGLAFYKEKKWQEAIELFNKILLKYPEDGPSEFYKKRCEYLMSNPVLTDGWNIIRMIEK